MTDIFKAATGEPDHKAIFDWLSPSLEPAAGSMGAPVWGGPDSAPSPTAQAFDIATGAITADSIAAHVITGDKMVAHTLTADEIDADYVATKVLNVGGTVAIDDTGERITGGKLTVTNGSSVVIIDGTSDMFKIVATGTQNVTTADGTSDFTTITLPSLGAQTVTPALIAMTGQANDSLALRSPAWYCVNDMSLLWAAEVSGGSPTRAFCAADATFGSRIYLDYGTRYPVVELDNYNYSTGGDITA